MRCDSGERGKFMGKKGFKNSYIKIVIFFGSLLVLNPAWALMEIGGSFGYDKNVYGAARENKLTTRTYSGNWSIYMLTNTALEFTYSESERITEEHTEYRLEDELANFSVIGNNTNIMTYVYGVGIKQAFAGRNAPFRPLISFGYAKQFVSSTGDTLYRFETTGQEFRYVQSTTKRRYDSVFGSFELKFVLFGRISFTTSVRTYFKAFEWNRAQDNMKYMAGLSWMF